MNRCMEAKMQKIEAEAQLKISGNTHTRKKKQQQKKQRAFDMLMHEGGPFMRLHSHLRGRVMGGTCGSRVHQKPLCEFVCKNSDSIKAYCRKLKNEQTWRNVTQPILEPFSGALCICSVCNKTPFVRVCVPACVWGP